MAAQYTGSNYLTYHHPSLSPRIHGVMETNQGYEGASVSPNTAGQPPYVAGTIPRPLPPGMLAIKLPDHQEVSTILLFLLTRYVELLVYF